MELDRIEQLLEKYFEATTTVAEKAELKAYFKQADVAPHLQVHAPLFQYFSQTKEEQFTKQVPLKPRKNYYRWISVAASVVLFFGIYFGNSSYQSYLETEKQNQEQAQYAYDETKKALNLLAENFGKGTEKVAYLKEFDKTTQKIYKNNN